MSTAATQRAPDPIAVTGIGLITPAGIGTKATWEGICAGHATATAVAELDGLPVTFACRVPGFDSRRDTGDGQAWRHDRFTQFALAAAHEAVADAALEPQKWDGRRVAIVLGSAAGGVGVYEGQHGKLLASGPHLVSPLTLPGYLPNMAAGQLAIDLRAQGPTLHTSTACASGATAVIIAAMLLERGECDVAIAGGSDAMVTRTCATAFARMGALSRRSDEPSAASRPFDAARDGFVLAEGAGVLVLEREEDAAIRHAPVHALLAGHGSTTDAHHPVAPEPEGQGLRRALNQALESAGAEQQEVDHINAHGTGTPLNDCAEARAVRAEFGASRPTVTAAKGVLGHMMGAAGAVEAALTALTVEHQLAPPIANFHTADSDTSAVNVVSGGPRRHAIRLAVSHSCGFGGHNTALAFRPGRDRRVDVHPYGVSGEF